MSNLKYYRFEPQRDPNASIESQLIEPFRLAPHVWMVSGHFDFSDILVDTGDGLLLIDTPTPVFSFALFDSIKKVGFDPKDIKWHFISHWHGDHDGCSADVKAASGCKIYMSSEDWNLKLNPPESQKRRKPMWEIPYYEPDVLIETDEAEFQLGNIKLYVLKTPGHTPGALTFRFDDVDEDGTVYHLAMHGGLGCAQMNTIAGMELEGIPAKCRDQFIDQCLEMSRWDVDIVLPSHINHTGYSRAYPEDRNDFKPFVDKRVWPVMLLERRGYVMERRGMENGKQ